MKKVLFFALAFISIGLFAQTDLSKYHDDGTLLVRLDENIALKSNAASPAFTGPATFSSTLNLGSFGDTQTVLSEASSNTNTLVGVFPMVNFDGSSGKVFSGTHNRLLVITTNQTNNTSMYGVESQFRLKGVNLSTGVHAGSWNYAEQSGTSVLSGGSIFTGLLATVESAATFTVGASEVVAGAVIDGSINAGATINGSANFSGLFIKSAGLDFHDGIYITGATNDIKLQNGGTIGNTHADTIFMTETAVSVKGALHVSGAITAEGNCCSDFAITDYQMPLLDYWAKTLELNKLPTMEFRNRHNIMDYIGGVEEANERNLRYIVEMEARIKILEGKLQE